MKTIYDFMDLFTIAAIVRIYVNDKLYYNGSAYSIPKKYMYHNLSSFSVCFEDDRLIYNFWI